MTNAQPSTKEKVLSSNPDKPPFAGWPVCCEDEQEAALSVLKSGKLNYWTGKEGRLFETEYADYVGVSHAIAVSNGTVGLELALIALEIGSGDEVIVPSRTFIATASAVAMCGAKPVCAEVDSNSQNITAGTIDALITTKTKAIIVVHLAGWPCDMEPIIELAKKHNLRVIEDCAQAHGATYYGQQVGSMGDFGVFSFCQDKIITTAGEGGMIVTNNQELWNRAWSFKDHGKCYDTVNNTDHPPGFRWLHKSFGTNGRMTEVQSAIGRIALQKLPDWVNLRRRNATMLLDQLKKCRALRTPEPDTMCQHSYYKLYTFVRPEMLSEGWNRDRIMQAINAKGVPCFSGSCSEIYLEEAFPTDWQPKKRHPIAKELGETSLMFLVHPTLELASIQQTKKVITEVMQQASDSGLEQKAIKSVA